MLWWKGDGDGMYFHSHIHFENAGGIYAFYNCWGRDGRFLGAWDAVDMFGVVMMVMVREEWSGFGTRGL